MKVLAVGDIHTKLDIVTQVEKVIDQYNAIVFVGDYADDWFSTPNDTIRTWRTLKKLQETYIGKIYITTGNHDYIYVNKTHTAASGYNQSTQLLLNMPDNKQLKEWVLNLPVSIRLDGVVYSHAGYTNDWMKFYEKDDLWNDVSPIWARPEGADGLQYVDSEPQVFGHTPSSTCWEVEPNIWCIDTFSTYPDGTPIGDGSVLEIQDGKTFTVTKLKEC